MSKPFARLDTHKVDEQIEQILHISPDQPRNEDERCIQDLQYLYRKEQILARAQQRLMIASPAPANAAPLDNPGEVTAAWQQNNTLLSKPYVSTRRKLFAWPKLAAALAIAVLLIATLIGTVQFLNTRVQPGVGQSHPGGVNGMATVMPTVTPTANVLLSDPLSTNIHKWPVKAHQYFFEDEAYHVAGLWPVQASAALLAGFTPATPWSYTLTMTQVHGDITSQTDNFGMIFACTRVNEQGKQVVRFYSLELAPASKGGTLLLYKYDNSQLSPWMEIWHGFATIHRQLGQANTVKVTATTDTLTFTVNGKVAGTVSDVKLGRGQIGMFVNLKGSEVAFQNLLVTRP